MADRPIENRHCEENGKPRVLFVDDDALIAFTTTSDLTDEGFEVVLRFNGQDGLEIALAEPFDLVITDHSMPDLSGLEMIAALRDAGATMPIVLATAVSAGSLPAPGSAGYDRLLPKPYRMAEIRALARHLIGTLRPMRAAPGSPVAAE